jgi:predicted RNA-binding Zn ribbon-like protein
MKVTALVHLANLGPPRRPSGASSQINEPLFADVATASRQLAGLTSVAIRYDDLVGLRHLQRFAVRASETLLQGDLPKPESLNRLAEESTARVRLTAHEGGLHAQFEWHDTSAVAELARILVVEIGVLEPARLHRCERAECGLLFYNATRSRTQRWHAEDPCGWRQRQEARRGRG